MNAEDVTLSEISQSRRDKFPMIPLCEVPRGGNFPETGSRMELEGRGNGESALTGRGAAGGGGEDGNILQTDGVSGHGAM